MVETVAKQESAPQEQVAPQASKKIKKKWVSLIAPKEFNNAFLGETFVEEQERAVGKVVHVNLMNLVHDPKKQNMVVSFSVTDVKNAQANTILTGYEIPPAHVKRLTKRSKAKVEDSFEYVTSDKIKMKIKTILMVRSETAKSKLTLLRIESRKFLADVVAKETFNNVMRNVVAGNLQRDLKGAIKKYHSLSAVVIRVAQKVPNQ